MNPIVLVAMCGMRRAVFLAALAICVGAMHPSSTSDRVLSLSEEGRLTPSVRAKLRAALREDALLDFAEKGVRFEESEDEFIIDVAKLEAIVYADSHALREIVVVTETSPDSTTTTKRPTRLGKNPGFLESLYRSIHGMV